MIRFLTVLAAGAALSACAVATDLLEQGRPYASRVASELVQATCALPIEERQKNHAAVMAHLAESGHVATFVLDCDADGEPDFAPLGTP